MSAHFALNKNINCALVYVSLPCKNSNNQHWVFSSPGHKQCELLPSLGVYHRGRMIIHRPLTFQIQIFFSETTSNKEKLGRKPRYKKRYLTPATTRTTRGHDQKFQIPFSRIQSHQNSYFPSAI